MTVEMRLPTFPEVQQSEHVIVFGVIECSFCFTRTLAELCRAGEDELAVQGFVQRRGEHRDAILRALGTADRDAAVRKVEILDPQAERFPEPES